MDAGKLILSVDIGTTEIKSVLVSAETGFLDSRQTACPLLYPDGNCVEQSPKDMADGIYSTIRELLKAHPERIQGIAGITFTSQMGNTLPAKRWGSATFQRSPDAPPAWAGGAPRLLFNPLYKVACVSPVGRESIGGRIHIRISN